mmetsp:Transcript_11898/g.15812  ORF Transcript_11898/g.15812 Transcript_11898/m.15812 type:complete len:333 (-) Transcript_11898:146-1144(-)
MVPQIHVAKPVEVQSRIASVLKKMVKACHKDFDKKATALLRLFVDEIIVPALGDLGTSVLVTLEKSLQEKPKPKFQTRPPDPIIPSKYSNCTFFDIDPLEMARQLTLIDFRLFAAIQPREVLCKNWISDEKEKLSPNVVEVLASMGQMSNIVSSTILGEYDLKKRALIFERWIEVIANLRALNNFNGVMKVLMGLNKAPIERLYATKAKIKKKPAQIFEEIQEFMSQKKPQTYQVELQKSSLPAIPYLGLYLNMLASIENRSPTFCSENIVNFQKCRQIGEVIEGFQRYQQVGYNLVELPVVNMYIQNATVYTMEEQLQRSMTLEKKDTKKK